MKTLGVIIGACVFVAGVVLVSAAGRIGSDAGFLTGWLLMPAGAILAAVCEADSTK